MLDINGRNIIITRGNVLPINVTANNIDGSDYEFKAGDVIRFTVTEKDKMEKVLLQKDFNIAEGGMIQQITIPATNMKIGELKSKPIDYWYEIEINPDMEDTMTIEGYDIDDGPALITILPEAGDKQPEGGEA